MNDKIIDWQEREDGTNPNINAIVQAPAGSGKTTLLAQRFMALLLCSKNPSEVVAITFGKKAAREIKTRIVDWLIIADSKEKNIDFLPVQAKQLLAYDKKKNWNLIQNQHLLQVKTIDAFFKEISSADIMHSNANSDLTDNSQPIYKDSAKKLVESINYASTSEELKKDLENSLNYVNGDSEKLIDELASMLKNRQSWNRLLVVANNQEDLKNEIEKNLHFYVKIICSDIADMLSCISNMSEIVFGIKKYCEETKNPTIDFSDFPVNSLPNKEDFKNWKIITSLFFTENKSIRKKPKPNLLPKKNDKKANEGENYNQIREYFDNARDELESIVDDDFIILIKHFYTSPFQVEQEQVQNLSSFIKVLYYALGYLDLEFKSKDKTDYTQITNQAIEALKNDNIAIKLNEQIKHLLIDEFQDTSITQLEILLKLTENWMQGENTLFVVGDPMQSIYTWRGAESYVFQHIWNNGWCNLNMTNLNLKTNFRSEKYLVDWFNGVMPNVLREGKNKNINYIFGKNTYVNAVATKNSPENGSKINFYKTNNQTECVADLIKKISHANPDDTIAILLTKNKFADKIIQELNAKNIPFDASSIRKLSNMESVQDLLSCLQLLFYPFSKFSNFAILRTAYFGITISEINLLIESKWHVGKAVEELNAKLQKSTIEKIELLNLAWKNIEKNIRIQEWSNLLKSFISNFPRAYNSDMDRVAEELFFKNLADNCTGIHIDWQVFILSLSEEKININSLENKEQKVVQIMTVHKAKGLEFDHVISPFVESSNGRGNINLPIFRSFSFATKERNILLIDIKQVKTTTANIYGMLGSLESIRQANEIKRTFYVLSTRASKSICFISEIDKKSQELKFKVNSIGKMLEKSNIEFIDYEKTFEQKEEENTPDIKSKFINLHSSTSNSYKNYITSAKNNTDKFTINTHQKNNHDNTHQSLTKRQLGTMMHSIVAQWLVSKDKFSFDNKNDVISFYCSHFSSLNKKHIFEVVEKLYVFFQKSHLKALDSKCIYVEKEIYFQGSVLIPDLFYIKDTHLFIIDFKSNQPKSDMELEKQKDMYKEQLDKYQLAITSKIKNITKVTSILIFPLAIKEISWEENS